MDHRYTYTNYCHHQPPFILPEPIPCWIGCTGFKFPAAAANPSRPCSSNPASQVGPITNSYRYDTHETPGSDGDPRISSNRGETYGTSGGYSNKTAGPHSSSELANKPDHRVHSDCSVTRGTTDGHLGPPFTPDTVRGSSTITRQRLSY